MYANFPHNITAKQDFIEHMLSLLKLHWTLLLLKRKYLSSTKVDMTPTNHTTNTWFEQESQAAIIDTSQDRKDQMQAERPFQMVGLPYQPKWRKTI